jgi:hypothetical protein
MHNRLHHHAYKVSHCAGFKAGYKPRRFQFAKDILSNAEADDNYPRRWIISDTLSGRVNPHNCRIRGSEHFTPFEKSKEIMKWRMSGVLCSVRKFWDPFLFAEQKHSTRNITFWFTLSNSVSSFILFPVRKLYATETTTNKLEPSYIILVTI